MPGSIRTAVDTTKVRIELALWNDRVVMRASDGELGDWPSAAVRLRPIDAGQFDLFAEGDHLIFAPDDPAAFRSGLLVVEDEPSQDTDQTRKEKRQARKAEMKETKRTRKAEKRSEKEPGDRVNDSVGSNPVPVEAPEEVQSPSQDSPEHKHDPRPADTDAGTETDIPDEKPDTAPEPESVSQPPPKPPKARRRALRLRLIDAARTRSLLDLDRVQIDMRQRGQDHQHTWEHRVAASSGPTSFICTICGRIKIRSR